MKRNLLWHPLLFAVYPILDLLLLNNQGIALAIRPFIVITLLTLGLMAVLHRYFKDWQRAAFLTTLTLFVVLYYGTLYRAAWNLHIGPWRIGRHSLLFPLWLGGIGIIGSRWTWKRLRDPDMISKLLNFVSVVAILLSAARYGLGRLSSKPADLNVITAANATAFQDITLETAPQSDIYYIIVDGYGRADMLQALYHFDNAEFLSALQSRGFYVAEKSQSNYLKTSLSLASSLNLNYLNALPFPSDTSDTMPLETLIHHSEIRRLLQEAGYILVTSPSGYPPTSIMDAETLLIPETPQGKLNTLEGLMVMNSVLVLAVDAGLLEVPSVGYQVNRNRIQSAFELLTETPALPSPKFVFFHIICPHPPFVFDAAGNAITPAVPYAGGGDGTHFVGTPDAYIAGYIAQLQYTNRQLLHVIDALLTQSATPPIIIIQGDHGPGAYLDWESAEKSCLYERASIFNAYYFPDGAYSRLYPEITPVNTFRVVLNTYFGANLVLLEDRSYYTAWDHPYDFVDVSAESQEPCILP